jgi:ABC-type antimicrobial peptide transport system permease subunit
VYVPYDAATSAETLVLARAATDGHRFLRAVADTAAAPAGARRPQPHVVGDTGTLADRGDGVLIVRMLGGFGLIALLLAASGVFGVISQSVAQRTREFGIRMALGATPRGVLRLVLARETKLIGAALATGALFTLGLTRVLFVELTRLSATAPSIWVVVMSLCGGVAAVACGLATWRIVRLEPAAILRRH